MNEPPDPGGTVPPAGAFVTICSNESGMDTDCSVSKRHLKRTRSYKICKQCNKRKRKHGSESGHDCGCSEESHVALSPKIPPTSSPNETPVQIGRSNYESNDHGPFVVHIQRILSSTDDGSTLHPVVFGRFLKKNSIQNIVNGSLKRIGRNRVTVSFSTFSDANSFLNSNSLIENKFKAFIPTFNVTRMGIIRGVPTEWSPEDIKDNTSVPIGCGPIIKIRRLNYKVTVDGAPSWKPSQTVVLTFDGQILPKRVFMCFNALPVELYTYPTIQCYNCCRFGHTKAQCRSKPRCYRCGQGHTGDACNIEEDCGNCCLCSGFHFATNKTCPEYNRQKQIKISMAENSISYIEACKLHPSVSRLYSDVLAALPSKPVQNGNTLVPGAPLNRTISYKKTVFSKPKPPPKLNKGYDRDAHEALIKDYNFPQPTNGCALQHDQSNKHGEQSLVNIIAALISLLTSSNLIPTDAALLINNLINKNNNGSINTPVELQKYNQ